MMRLVENSTISRTSKVCENVESEEQCATTILFLVWQRDCRALPRTDNRHDRDD